MIVDQAVYRDGVRRGCGDLSDELGALSTQRDSDFLWIGLKDPTTAEFADVQDELGLHPLAIEDAVTGGQRAKMELYDDTIFVVLKTLSYTEATSQVETGELMMFVGPHFVLTVRRGEHSPLASVRKTLEHTPDLLAHGPIAVLHKVMDDVVDQYERVDRDLGEDLDTLEHLVFTPGEDVDVSALYSLRREVLEVRRAAQPLVEPLGKLLRSSHVPTEAMPFFRDIHDHVLRVVDQVEAYDRLLSDILGAHLAQVSVRQNEDMRKISAWVAIAAVPTMIAGVYGMNFQFMPELTASIDVGGREFYYGYFVVLAVMIGACAVLYRLFKRSGWL